MQTAQKKMSLNMANSDPKSKLRGQIDENLKRIYDETLNEQIPDRLTQLLDQLRQKLPPKPEGDDGGKA
jgi:hypothetical protein